MREEHLRSLMEQVKSGELSRNKHFDRFRDPLVREARRRQKRLEKLASLLSEARDVTLDRGNRGSGTWLLGCTFPDQHIKWSASLDDFELEMLQNHPKVRQLMGMSTG